MFPTAAPGWCPAQHPPTRHIHQQAVMRSIQAAPILWAAKRAQAVLSPPIVRADSPMFSPPPKALSRSSASRLHQHRGLCASGEKCTALTHRNLRVCYNASNTDCNNIAKLAKPPNARECPLRKETANSAKSAMPKTSVQRVRLLVILQQGANSGICFEECTTTRACPNGETCKTLTNGTAACACQGDSECSGGKVCTSDPFAVQQHQQPTQTRRTLRQQHPCATGLMCVAATQERNHGAFAITCVPPQALVSQEKKCRMPWKLAEKPVPAKTITTATTANLPKLPDVSAVPTPRR